MYSYFFYIWQFFLCQEVFLWHRNRYIWEFLSVWLANQTFTKRTSKRPEGLTRPRRMVHTPTWLKRTLIHRFQDRHIYQLETKTKFRRPGRVGEIISIWPELWPRIERKRSGKFHLVKRHRGHASRGALSRKQPQRTSLGVWTQTRRSRAMLNYIYTHQHYTCITIQSMIFILFIKSLFLVLLNPPPPAPCIHSFCFCLELQCIGGLPHFLKLFNSISILTVNAYFFAKGEGRGGRGCSSV